MVVRDAEHSVVTETTLLEALNKNLKKADDDCAIFFEPPAVYVIQKLELYQVLNHTK